PREHWGRGGCVMVANLRETPSTVSGLSFVAGLWLFMSGYLMTTAPGNVMTNNIITGALVIVLAAIRFLGAPRAAWLSWLTALVGLWTLISPWALRFSAWGRPTANNVIVGIVIAALGCLGGVDVTTGVTGRHARTGV